MKTWYLSLTVSVLLAIGSIYLASNDKEGWGWFLFGSLCTFVYPSKNKSGDDTLK